MVKNFKRIFTLVLAVVMCLSILTVGALAAPVRTNYPITKTANGLDENDQTDVTLAVPGDHVEVGVDIIYIVGSYASNSDGTPNVHGDVLISSLVETITDIVNSGTPINFGMVPFSSDNVIAMPLTAITKDNLAELPTMIADALSTCESLYDGVNMENALIKSKKMFSDSPLAAHPERQHLVMITSGFTYFFNSGANNEYISTVPVNYEGVNRLFFWNKAWQRARTNQTNTYPVPKGIVEAYAEQGSGMSLWEFYWSYIEQWVAADRAAGDGVVYEACTVESAEFLNWYNSGELVSGYSQTGYGKAIPNTTDEDIANAVTLKAGDNPLSEDPVISARSSHAIGYERAMYEAYEYAKANFIDAGINFYPIYNALNVNYTNGNPSPSSYNVNWTDQYIGHSFVDLLAGGEGKAVKYDKKDDKAFFDPIKKSILYTCSIGSYVEDFIGKNENGNFEFIENADYIKLNVGGVDYTTEQIDTNEDATSSYAFTAPGAAEPTFWLDYYYGDGVTTERFVWTFGESIDMSRPAKLTYKLQLTEKCDEDGTYIVPTNNSATLYPVDSDGNKGNPQIFPVPEVDYDVKHEEPPVTPPTIEFKPGEASNISFMLIDAEGNVEFLYKVDIENETSFEIPTEEGKISAVFVKQSTSGMFWFAEKVDEDVQQAVIDCLKANNPSYKGHNAIAFGAGEHELEFKKNKFATYVFSGDIGENVVVEAPKTEAPEAEEPKTEEPKSEEPVEEPKVEEPAVPEVVAPKVTVEGAKVASQTFKNGISAVYVAAEGKVPAVVWVSDEVSDEELDAIIEELGADEDVKVVVGEGSHKIEYKHNKNKTKTVTYTFTIAD